MQGIETALEIKFGEQGLRLMDTIAKISQIDELQNVRELLKKSRDIDEFRRGLGRQNPSFCTIIQNFAAST